MRRSPVFCDAVEGPKILFACCLQTTLGAVVAQCSKLTCGIVVFLCFAMHDGIARCPWDYSTAVSVIVGGGKRAGLRFRSTADVHLPPPASLAFLAFWILDCLFCKSRFCEMCILCVCSKSRGGKDHVFWKGSNGARGLAWRCCAAVILFPVPTCIIASIPRVEA